MPGVEKNLLGDIFRILDIPDPKIDVAEDRRDMLLVEQAKGVGVASLGVLAIRSVIERKQEIGIMRAIGYRKGMVLGVFSTEMLFVTVGGILVGLGTGIITGYGIWKTSMSDFALDFVMPWDNVLMVIAITILAAIVCTFLPALKASRTNPAEAVRWIE